MEQVHKCGLGLHSRVERCKPGALGELAPGKGDLWLTWSCPGRLGYLGYQEV